MAHVTGWEPRLQRQGALRMTFMVQYNDAYGYLHNEIIVAYSIDAAWDLAVKLLGSESCIQQIWEV